MDSYSAPALGTWDADFGIYQGRAGDPRNDDEGDNHAWADAIELAAEELGEAAGYARRDNEIRAEQYVNMALQTLGKDALKTHEQAYALLFAENARLNKLIERLQASKVTA